MNESGLTNADVADYFRRIAHSGAREPSLAVLQALIRRHVAAIPFENLDPLLHRRVDIALPAVVAKLVRGRRGGYCFEQNQLFYEVLQRLGFDVTPLSARVIWQAPANAPLPPLTHRFTRVRLPDGDLLADVGFGGQNPTAPLRLVTDAKQQTDHGCYRIVARPGDFELQFLRGDDWAGMYRFTLETRVASDFEMGNWFTSTFPRSRFRENLIAAIVSPTGRINLLNRTVNESGPDGIFATRTLTDARDLERLLVETYGLALPADAATIWERLPA